MKSHRRPPRRTRGGEHGRARGASGAGRSTEVEGELLEVEVERILPGGLGLAHADGRTVLVALSAPGDRATVRVRSRKGRTLFASIERLVAPSPARVSPPCPYFGRCGGCDFQQLSYEAQLAAKVEIIRDCLRRLAHTEPPADIPITPSPAEWRYRSRAQWQYDAVRRRLGYFERGTHSVCDVIDCPVVVEPLQETLTELRSLVRDDSMPDASAEFEAVAGDGGVALTPPLLDEHSREQTREVAGHRYRFDATCFFQINHALLEPLVTESLRQADNSAEGREGGAAGLALDLYCGVGLFTLPLARRFRQVIGVEGHPRACAYARRNLSDAGISNARVEESGVGPWMAAHAASLPAVDFVLLDPPRAGAEPEAIDALKSLRPARITYVSCDPATLARDLAHLLAAGYRLTSLRAFDLFPQTHHVETVAHLALTSS
jgi:23S rRNA (uracil1939-C5)-methyltransferase